MWSGRLWSSHVLESAGETVWGALCSAIAWPRSFYEHSLSRVWRFVGAVSLHEGREGEGDAALFAPGKSTREMQRGGVFWRTRWVLVAQVWHAEDWEFGEVEWARAQSHFKGDRTHLEYRAVQIGLPSECKILVASHQSFAAKPFLSIFSRQLHKHLYRQWFQSEFWASA